MWFLDNLFTAFGTLHDDLKALSKSIRDQAEATKHASASEKTQKVPQPVTISIPEGIENRKNASDKKDEADYQTKTLFWQKWTFAALGIYALFTAGMYCANRDSADAATSAAKTASDQLAEMRKVGELQEAQARKAGGEPYIVYEGIQLGHDSRGIFVDVNARNDGAPKADKTEIAVSLQFATRPSNVGVFIGADSQGETKRTRRLWMEDSKPTSLDDKLFIRGVIRYQGKDERHFEDIPFCKVTSANTVLGKTPMPDDSRHNPYFPDPDHADEYRYLSPPSPIDSCD